MKRDMDVIRQIALETSKLKYGEVLESLDGVEPVTFAMHAIWMKEAGLITASIQEFLSGEPPDAHIFRLTWDGCEFADSVRSDTLWRKAKESVIKPSTSFTFGLLKEWLSTEIREGFPTLR